MCPPMRLPKPGRLAADVKIRAQLRHRELAGADQTDQSMLLFHGGYFVSGHSPERVTHVPGQSVTYVPGSYRRAINRTERVISLVKGNMLEDFVPAMAPGLFDAYAVYDIKPLQKQ